MVNLNNNLFLEERGVNLNKWRRFQLIKFKHYILNSKSVAVACHQNADPDAVCSAFALLKLLKKINKRLKISLIAPEGISRISKQILKVIPAFFVNDLDLKFVNLIFLVDTSTVKQLGGFGERILKLKKPVIIIDHHIKHPEMKKIAKLFLVNEEATSTCELIYTLYQNLKIKPLKIAAQALMIGLTFDTRHFILANLHTFQTAVGLCKFGAQPEKVIELLKIPLERPERIARLKAAQRMDIKEVEGWMVATSIVSSFQASAARAIIALGADVAIVCGEKKGKIKVNLRAANEFYRVTGIHLGRDLAVPLGRLLNGVGSGHAVAAGVNGYGDLNKAINQSISLLMNLLKI
ncbi:DHH family phosphoesterase [Candidatus Bathyarchaeota archaeon]|nr:DHH family phosphoesterase [Candidatus Bathyarchaeota archaeon]